MHYRHVPVLFCVIIFPSGCCCVTRWCRGFYLGTVQYRCSHSCCSRSPVCSFVVVFPLPHSTALPVLFLHECCVLQVASLFTGGHAGFQRASFLCAKLEPGLSRWTSHTTQVLECLTFLAALDGDAAYQMFAISMHPKGLVPFWHISFNIQTACCGMIEVGVLYTSLWGFSSTAVNHRTRSLWLQTCPCFVRILPAGLLD